MCFVTSHPHTVLSVIGIDNPCAKYCENRAVCVDTCVVVGEDGSEDVCERGDVLTLLSAAPSADGCWLAKHHRPGTGNQQKEKSFRCPLGKVSCNLVEAVHDYTGEDDDRKGKENTETPTGVPSSSPQLLFSAGETILVHRRWNDGWWEGSVLRREGPGRERRGVFPSNFTVPNYSTTTPQLFCNECKMVLPVDPQGSRGKTPSCPRCNMKKGVVEHMLRILEDYSPEKSGGKKLDLFRDLSIQPRAATSSSFESSSRIMISSS